MQLPGPNFCYLVNLFSNNNPIIAMIVFHLSGEKKISFVERFSATAEKIWSETNLGLLTTDWIPSRFSLSPFLPSFPLPFLLTQCPWLPEITPIIESMSFLWRVFLKALIRIIDKIIPHPSWSCSFWEFTPVTPVWNHMSSYLVLSGRQISVTR